MRRTQPNDRPGGPGEPPMTRHSLTFGNKEPDARLQRRPEQRPGYTKIKSADHFFTLSYLLAASIPDFREKYSYNSVTKGCSPFYV